MTEFEKYIWEKKIANASGYTRVNSVDACYETGGEQYTILKNDLISGIKEFLTFPNIASGEVTIRAEAIESLVWLSQEEITYAYEDLVRGSVLGD